MFRGLRRLKMVPEVIIKIDDEKTCGEVDSYKFNWVKLLTVTVRARI